MSAARRGEPADPAPGGAGARAARVPIPREIWILVGAAFVIAIGFGIVSPVLPSYARSFDVGVAAASVIVSAFAFFRLVFAPAGGALVEKLGERPVYLAGLLIVAVSSFATAFAQSYCSHRRPPAGGSPPPTPPPSSSGACSVRCWAG